MTAATTPADTDKKTFIDDLINRMTLEQKVGQCFTMLWGGHLVGPSVIEAIEKLHCGALRLQTMKTSGARGKYYDFKGDQAYAYPKGYNPAAADYQAPGFLAAVGPEAYATSVNMLQDLATRQPGGVPLGMTIDQEGDVSRDFCGGGINFFPSCMGQTASGDPDFVYQVNLTLARQLSAMGVTTMHSPVVDVNMNPRNPEIGVRSYGDDPETVATYALAAMKGMQDGGIICTAKHFPGRGDSVGDAHFEVPVLEVDRKRMLEVELYPYRKLIEGGLDSIMIAHNVYPAFDNSGAIATFSKPILQDLIRGELGFEGVVTTDAIAMGAVLKFYPVGEACARALAAGCDMVLNRMENEIRDHGILETLRLVEDGTISEDDLNAKVRRILTMKWNRGLFKTGGKVKVEQSGALFRDPKTKEIARSAARRASYLIRDEQNVLPLKEGQRVMVIEQGMMEDILGHTDHFHRLSFTERMLEHNRRATFGFDTKQGASDEEQQLAVDVSESMDVVVVTNHYDRRWRSDNLSPLVKKLIAAGRKVVVVCNSPYPMSVVPEAKTVLCTFSATPESMRMAADILFGKEKPQGKWPLKLWQPGDERKESRQ